MKKSILSLMIVTAVSFLVACGGSESPKSVAEKFLQATSELKFEEAKKFCTPETGKFLDMMSSLTAMMPDSAKNKKSKFEMISEDIKEDVATVTYTENAKTDKQTIKLKKVEGKWLVSMGKEDMKTKDGKKESESGAETTDTATVPAEESAPAETK
jgi:hypothetical protein